ncbi:MAG: carbon-nitrogen hydrolase family protein [Acidobacteria bacterium]|nr:carbon-nitrogen hydrolase family protein [Acidobacteriota bacterium]
MHLHIVNMFYSGLLVAAFVPAAPLAAQSQPVSLKVAAVQFRSTPRIEDNVTRMAELLGRLADDGVRVAVFPECALTQYRKDSILEADPKEVAAAEEKLRMVCRRKRIAAIFGSVYKTNGRVYNTAVVFDAQGELVDRYGKVYLAGEQWFTPGNHISYFELDGVPSTVMICHDERYPELVRLPAIQGARIAYYISHESGLRQESKLAPYRAQLMARAVENRVFIVAANAPSDPKDLSGSHGQSRIVNDEGNVMKEASYFGEEILIETLPVKAARLERPLKELMGDWWRQGVDSMMKNRRRSLD